MSGSKAKVESEGCGEMGQICQHTKKGNNRDKEMLEYWVTVKNIR